MSTWFLLAALSACASAPASDVPADDALPALQDGAQAMEASAPQDGVQAAPQAQASPGASDLQAAVTSALAAGDFAAAREAIDELEVQSVLARASEQLGSGEARAALVPLDRGIKLQPDNVRLLELRADAAMAAAAGDSKPQFFYEDALRYYKRAAQAGFRSSGGKAGPRVLNWTLRASQAARLVPKPDEARSLAQKAMEVQQSLEEEGVALLPGTPPLHRVRAEASFDNYRAAKGEGKEGLATDLFTETEAGLERALAERPEDPWALQQLSNLYLWEGRATDARTAMERAVELSPDDEATHQAAFRMVWERFGAAEAITYAEGLRQRAPDSPFGHWYGGSAELYSALEAFLAQDSVRDEEAFRRAEAHFARCREVEASYGVNCLNHEATARTAIGWCRYNEGDMAGAEEAFFSAGELFEGGLQTSVDARLPDAVAGLSFVAAKHAENPRDVSGQESAASIAWRVHEAIPDDANLANNAGFFNRDAAVLRHALSHQARTRGVDQDDQAERERLAASSREWRDQAQMLIQRSWEAYERAAALAPDDVRIVNDAGLIMTYYLRTDAERARELLLQSIAAGEEQRAWSDPESDLNEAWGDAHQNLAVLYLTWLDDPALAKKHMAKALEVGPASRERLRGMLEFCDQRIAGEVTGGGAFDQMVWPDSPLR